MSRCCPRRRWRRDRVALLPVRPRPRLWVARGLLLLARGGCLVGCGVVGLVAATTLTRISIHRGAVRSVASVGGCPVGPVAAVATRRLPPGRRGAQSRRTRRRGGAATKLLLRLPADVLPVGRGAEAGEGEEVLPPLLPGLLTPTVPPVLHLLPRLRLFC